MRDVDLNRRYSESHARTIDGIAAALERLYEGAGRNPFTLDLASGRIGQSVTW